MPSNTAHTQSTPFSPIGWNRDRRHRLEEGGKCKHGGWLQCHSAVAFVWGHQRRLRFVPAFGWGLWRSLCVCVGGGKRWEFHFLTVSHRFTSLFYLPRCGRDFHWQASDSNQPSHQSTARCLSNCSGVLLPTISSWIPVKFLKEKVTENENDVIIYSTSCRKPDWLSLTIKQ